VNRLIVFENYRPARRYPPVLTPWTKVRVDQAPDVAGAPGVFATIETITFATPDPDPTKPQLRSFSSALATLDHGWWRAVFLDADGVEGFTEPFEAYLASDPFASWRRRLAQMVDADVAPVLSDQDLDELLAGARLRDRAGLLPSTAGWVPTFHLTAAAAEGWRRKAGRAAAAHSYANGALRSERAQIHVHCLAMAREYARRIRHSAVVKSGTIAALEAELAAEANA
jgi:hypothetical protein